MVVQAGKPELIKKMNMQLIYRQLISHQSATRGEIAGRTQMSVTTVRSLLEELLALGEIEEIRLDRSSGGRRPQRYALSPARNQMLLMILEMDHLEYRALSLSGAVLTAGQIPLHPAAAGEDVTALAARFCQAHPISAIGLGAPGIVAQDSFLVEEGRQWVANQIGRQLSHALGIPVLLENDLNAIALGFCRRYSRHHTECEPEQMNLAYIHFNQSCTGAGIVSGGRVIRGERNFAGELGFLPVSPQKNLDQALAGAQTQEEQAFYMAQAIAGVNCVVNPSLVAVGGDLFAAHPLPLSLIEQALKGQVPERMRPQLIWADRGREDYLAGLYELTAQMILPMLPQPAAVE